MTDQGIHIARVSQPTLVFFGDRDRKEPLISIHFDGRIEYGSDYTPDDAAKAFWQAVSRSAPQPALQSRIEALETENERLFEMLTKFANASSDICEVVKKGGSDSEAMQVFFTRLTNMMGGIMKLRADLEKKHE